MKIIKIVTLALLFVITAPTILSAISSFYDIDCELICCENSTEEEKKEKKSEKELDDLEEYLLSRAAALSEQNFDICIYSFGGKHFIDIVSDIVTPPPEA